MKFGKIMKKIQFSLHALHDLHGKNIATHFREFLRNGISLTCYSLATRGFLSSLGMTNAVSSPRRKNHSFFYDALKRYT